MKKYIVVLLACFMTFPASAETVKLKSGKVVEGKIVERNEKFIKVDQGIGVNITYYLEEIENINGGDLEDSGDAGVAATKKFYAFKLGKQTIDGNDFDFNFPGDGDSLYLFSLGHWTGPKKENTKLVVALYDAQKQLLVTEDSVCVGKSGPPFGSIGFWADVINKKNIQNVSYFTFSVEDCSKDESIVRENSQLDETRPEVIFARQVEAATKRGESDFFALFSDMPKNSEEKEFFKEFIFNPLHELLINSGKITSVRPMDEKGKQDVKSLCAEPFEIEFEQKDSSSSTKLSVPIGQVNGTWKMLNNQK